jgi:indolepyruvate ferredoxin oxidoreductase beta subunit
MSNRVTNIVLGGLGGQGVLTASDILADAAFRAGFDVKKSELHGMSQRGGSVSSDVRYGPRVLSPMVPPARPTSCWCWSPPRWRSTGRC